MQRRSGPGIRVLSAVGVPLKNGAEPETGWRALIPVVQDDFPTYLTDLTVEQVTLFCLREDGFAQELRVLPVRPLRSPACRQ